MTGFCPSCQKVQLVTIETPSRYTVCQKFWRAGGVTIPTAPTTLTRKYALSEDDRKMLRSGGIDPEI